MGAVVGYSMDETFRRDQGCGHLITEGTRCGSERRPETKRVGRRTVRAAEFHAFPVKP